jgi:hypothetical protein
LVGEESAMKPLVAQLSSGDRATDQRGTMRRALKLHVASADQDRGSKVLIHNISEGGMLIETSARLAVGDVLQVHLPHAGSTDARVIRSQGQFFGCRFTSRISRGTVSAALLRAPAGDEIASASLASAPAWAREVAEEEAASRAGDGENVVAIVALMFLSLAVLFFLYAMLELQIAM